MSLKNISQDSREIVRPNQNSRSVLIERPISTPNPVENVEVSIEGYSNSFGGQLVDRSFEPEEYKVEEKTLKITVPSPSVGGIQGGDYIITYSIEDSTGSVDTNRFFYQNGVYSDKTPGDLTARVSAELERLSQTILDGESVKQINNFANLGGDPLSVSSLVYDKSGDVFEKHNEEPIPYFKNPGKVDFPQDIFSSRNTTIIAVLQWQQVFDDSFSVFRVLQGGKKFFEVRNEQENISVDSDFSQSTIYKNFTESSSIAIISCKVDVPSGKVFGSVNSEIERPRSDIAGSFSSGNAKATLNPEGKSENVRLFDFLTYDNSLSTAEIDKISKQLSYFYNANLKDPSETTVGKGSSEIQNHMFYDKNTQKYDLAVASDPVVSFDVEMDPQVTEWTHSRSCESVAFNSRQKSAVGTGSDNNVIFLTSEGDRIWEFDGHSDKVNAVETGKESFVYSASEDGTVKKIGSRGNEIWNFGEHSGPVNDIALFRDLALYTASEDQTVRRIVENGGSENWVFTEHLAPVTCLAVDKNEIIYTGAANGELRVIDNDGNQVFVETPFSYPIEDVSVVGDSLYVVGGNKIKKLQTSNGEEVWSVAISSETFEAVSVHPDGHVFAAAGDLIIEYDQNGEKVTDFQAAGPVKDISVQPGSYEPHWKS